MREPRSVRRVAAAFPRSEATSDSIAGSNLATTIALGRQSPLLATRYPTAELPHHNEGGRSSTACRQGSTRRDATPFTLPNSKPSEGEPAMNQRHRRRRFLQMASAIGLGAELGPWAELMSITPAAGRGCPAQARDGQVSPRDRAHRAPDRRHSARPCPRSRDRAAQEGAVVQESARRACSWRASATSSRGRSASSFTP